MRAKLYKGVSVVVTGGAEALGQAVISLCLKHGHNVYATVNTIQKKKLLLKLFPTLKESHIFYTTDEHFVPFLYNNGDSKRLNVVINSSSGVMRQQMMTCVGPNGYFLDMSKNDIFENEPIGMDFLNWDRSYVTVDISNIFNVENEMQRKKLQIMLSDGIAKGYVKPITCVEFSPPDISRACHLIASRKLGGKVLINLQKPIFGDISKSSGRIKCSPENSFIVLCDKTDSGLEVIDLLVKRGARRIVLHLKTNISGYLKSKLASWEECNVAVNLMFNDIDNEEGCLNIFKQAKLMGPIEGVFIFPNRSNIGKIENIDALGTTFSTLSSYLFNLDALSRQFATDTLRYFVILTQPSSISDGYVYSVSEEICRARNAVGLSGLVLRAELTYEHSPNLDINYKAKKPLNVSTFNRLLETSLRLNLNIVESFNVDEMTLEMEDFQNNGSTLLDKAMLSENSVVASYDSITNNKSKAWNKFNYTRSDTIRRDIKLKTKFDGGFETFYNFVDDDVYNAAVPFVSMRTRVSDEFKDKHEVDANDRYLMILPGFDGHHKIFEYLCLRLKIKAFTIQLDPDMKHDSIKQIAERILLMLKERLILKKKFYLLGYSFGVNIALELTAMLEKEGHIGTVFCLDSSPDVLRLQLDTYIGELSEIQLKNFTLQKMLKLLTKNCVTVLSDDVKTEYDWSKKIYLFINQIKNFVSYPHQYIKCLLDSAYQRIVLAQNYSPSFILNSQLVLIKGIPHPELQSLPNDYNLTKYCKNDVKIFDIDSDIAFAPYDHKVTNIINKMLDPETLPQFLEF